MIKSIMVCTDGSAYAATALKYGLLLAREMQADLRGLYVQDVRMLEVVPVTITDAATMSGPDVYPVEYEKIRELMQKKADAVSDAFAAVCGSQGLSEKLESVLGHPVSMILQEEAKTEMLVLGLRGENAELGGELVGSTVERVVRKSLKPCLITPEKFAPIQHVLVAFDGSDHASRALQVAIETAQALQARLTLVTVQEGGASAADAESRQATGVQLAAAHNCPVETVLRCGKPAETLLAIARERNADLLVAGTHGHSAIRELLMGSVTTQLLHHMDRPLLLVR